MPYAHEWDEAKQLPKALYTKAAEAGLLPAVIGLPYPKGYVDAPIIGGVTPDEYDAFHEVRSPFSSFVIFYVFLFYLFWFCENKAMIYKCVFARIKTT